MSKYLLVWFVVSMYESYSFRLWTVNEFSEIFQKDKSISRYHRNIEGMLRHVYDKIYEDIRYICTSLHHFLRRLWIWDMKIQHLVLMEETIVLKDKINCFATCYKKDVYRFPERYTITNLVVY